MRQTVAEACSRAPQTVAQQYRWRQLQPLLTAHCSYRRSLVCRLGDWHTCLRRAAYRLSASAYRWNSLPAIDKVTSPCFSLQEFASADEADIAIDMDSEVRLPSQQRVAATLPTGPADTIQVQQTSGAHAAGSAAKAGLSDHTNDAVLQRTTQLGSTQRAAIVRHVGDARVSQRDAPATQPSDIASATTAEATPSALFGAATADGMTPGAIGTGAKEVDSMQAGEHRGPDPLARSSARGGGFMQTLAAAPDALRGAPFSRTGGGGGDGARGSGFAAVMSVETSGEYRALLARRASQAPHALVTRAELPGGRPITRAPPRQPCRPSSRFIRNAFAPPLSSRVCRVTEDVLLACGDGEPLCWSLHEPQQQGSDRALALQVSPRRRFLRQSCPASRSAVLIEPA